MTFKELCEIMIANDIPEDAQIFSMNSKGIWDVNVTIGIWDEENAIVIIPTDSIIFGAYTLCE